MGESRHSIVLYAKSLCNGATEKSLLYDSIKKGRCKGKGKRRFSYGSCFALPNRAQLDYNKTMPFFKRVTGFFLLLILAACAPKSLAPVMVPDGVRFSYYAPKATGVSIVGSFNHWDPEQDRLTGPDSNGVWTVVLPLPPGRYEYHFVINGKEWVLDPSAPSEDDGLGGFNSLFVYEP